MTQAPQKSRAKQLKRGIPALELSGPRTLGLAATLALAVLASAAAIVTVPTGALTTARGRIQAEPIAMRHADGGVVARVHVKEGAEVESGTLIATFDTRLIDNQIAGLTRQMDGIQMHIGGLKQEAEALAAPERHAASRSRLAGLEAQIATYEQEGFGLEVRLEMAKQERKRTEIRAPMRGHMLKLAVADLASVPPNGMIAEIQPAADHLVLETTWVAADAHHAVRGQPVSVWLNGTMPWSRALAGRVEQILTDEAQRPGAAKVRLRISADLTNADIPEADRLMGERDFTVQLVSGAPSLLSVLVAPLFAAAPTHLSTQKVQP